MDDYYNNEGDRCYNNEYVTAKKNQTILYITKRVKYVEE